MWVLLLSSQNAPGVLALWGPATSGSTYQYFLTYVQLMALSHIYTTLSLSLSLPPLPIPHELFSTAGCLLLFLQ